MATQKPVPITLPALRGVMGNWVYYSCLMGIKELANRVSYADEVHKNQGLSDMIQRQLKKSRSAQIAEYVEEQPERFFNSLVVATYGGHPKWHELDSVKSTEKKALTDLDEATISSVGFLEFDGTEKLFAIDGQHRLAGIKKAIKDGLQQDPFDDISVIFVAHEKSAKGMARTRRLFTTLNKTAKPVSKGDIIALDEDDVMAICVRRLIEETTLFKDDRIAFVATNNMPTANLVALTTIGNLYDVLTILFTTANTDLKAPKASLQKMRPDDETLDKYFSLAENYFELLRDNVSELKNFFGATDTETVVKKQRGSFGGSFLFRPLGLDIFTRVVAKLTKTLSLADAVKRAALLPRTLSKAPFEGLLWDTSNKTILSGHNVTLREILLYMVGASAMSEQKLTERYRKETGDDKLALPKQIAG
jgi:DNA sulfur modification protein DndB